MDSLDIIYEASEGQRLDIAIESWPWKGPSIQSRATSQVLPSHYYTSRDLDHLQLTCLSLQLNIPIPRASSKKYSRFYSRYCLFATFTGSRQQGPCAPSTPFKSTSYQQIMRKPIEAVPAAPLIAGIRYLV